MQALPVLLDLLVRWRREWLAAMGAARSSTPEAAAAPGGRLKVHVRPGAVSGRATPVCRATREGRSVPVGLGSRVVAARVGLAAQGRQSHRRCPPAVPPSFRLEWPRIPALDRRAGVKTDRSPQCSSRSSPVPPFPNPPRTELASGTAIGNRRPKRFPVHQLKIVNSVAIP
jgi:hypothetical protein